MCHQRATRMTWQHAGHMPHVAPFETTKLPVDETLHTIACIQFSVPLLGCLCVCDAHPHPPAKANSLLCMVVSHQLDNSSSACCTPHVGSPCCAPCCTPSCSPWCVLPGLYPVRDLMLLPMLHPCVTITCICSDIKRDYTSRFLF
jgi:hypothetical protein